MSSVGRRLLTTNSLITLQLLVGLANNIAIAAVFGLTRRVDAFYAALVLPSLFAGLFLDYLGRNFLPILAKAHKESDRLASELTSSVVTIVAVGSVGVVLVLVAASRPVFGVLLPGFAPEDVALVVHYFWIMAPAIALMAATTFHQYVCQYDERYTHITATQAALPLANLAAIMLAGPFIGEYALPVGYTAGHAIVFVLMTRHARYRYKFRMKIRREWEGKVFTNSAIVMASGTIARTRLLMMNYFASLLGDGAIAALGLASKLVDPLKRNLFTAVRMLMFSRAARAAADGNERDIGRLLRITIGASFLALAPLVWWIALNSDAIVQTLLMRGEFDAEMAALVALALIGLTPTLLLDGIAAFVSNTYYALDRIKVTAIVTPLGALLYLLLASLLAPRLGVLGLTLSMSASTAGYLGVLLVLLPRHLPHVGIARVTGGALKYAAVAGLCLALPVVSLEVLGLPPLVVAAASLLVGLAAYAGALIVAQDPLLAVMQGYFRKPLPLQSVGGPGG